HKLLPNPRIEVAAVCDVDRNHRDEAAKLCFERTKKRVGVYNDFRELLERKDIDAVLVATPDHWHALASIHAMEAGKDVYCEKPLTLTIEESQKMVAAARRYGAVLQTGSQQRSDNRFRLACELVRNGVIGKLKRVDTMIGGVGAGDWQKPTTPPAELDWDMWLGPAPYAEYFPNRVHYQFRWFLDYSGGKMTDWGAHHNDIAQWGIGADGSGPVKVKGAGKFHENGPHDVATDFNIQYTYGPEHGDVELHCHADGDNGVKFTGADGFVFVSRGRIEISKGETSLKEYDAIVKEYKPESFKTKLYNSRDHHENWLDCIASRELPICDVEVGHRSVTVCHLGNIALQLGRELNWDPKAEAFVGDETAQRLTSRPMRGPWHL
ncbi:MAG: Gfo/Idh/MocA family protein, partial [Planctomycetia bacterium]